MSREVADGELANALVALARMTEVALEECGLTVTQYRLLTYLAENPSLPSELAFRFALRKQSVSRLITGFVERGFVERWTDPDDGRRVNPVVTAAGRKALRAADRELDAYLDGAWEYVEPDGDDPALAYDGVRRLGAALRASWDRYLDEGTDDVPRARRAPPR